MIAFWGVLLFGLLANDLSKEQRDAALEYRQARVTAIEGEIRELVSRLNSLRHNVDATRILKQEIQEKRKQRDVTKRASLDKLLEQKAAEEKDNANRPMSLDEFFAWVESPNPRLAPAAESPTRSEVMGVTELQEPEQEDQNTGLTVRFPYSKVWIPNGGESVEYGICEVLLDAKEPTQGFFSVGNEPFQIEIESSDPDVVLPTKDPKHSEGPYFFVFRSQGRATLTITVGPFVAKQEFEVVEAPVAFGDDTEKVIRSLGLPSHKSEIYVTWPNTEEKECFIYSPEAGDPFIGEHWWFDDHNDLILSIGKGSVVKLGTNRRNDRNKVELRVAVPSLR